MPLLLLFCRVGLWRDRRENIRTWLREFGVTDVADDGRDSVVGKLAGRAVRYEIDPGGEDEQGWTKASIDLPLTAPYFEMYLSRQYGSTAKRVARGDMIDVEV